MSLLVFNFELKKLIKFFQRKIELIPERHETLISLAISDSNDHVLLEIGGYRGLIGSSRMMISEILKNQFIKRAIFDPFEQAIQQKYALCCCESQFFGLG